MAYNPHKVRCRATSKQRKKANPDAPPEELRCRRWATPGALVCKFHGSRSPQVKKKAQDRLLELADPATAVLARVLEDEDVDPAVRVRAATAILDRSGHGPTTKQVNVDGGQLAYRIEGVDMDAV